MRFSLRQFQMLLKFPLSLSEPIRHVYLLCILSQSIWSNRKRQQTLVVSFKLSTNLKALKLLLSPYLTDANYQNQHSTAISDNAGNKPDPELWMDRLNQLRAKANLAPHRNNDGSLLTNSHLLMMDNKAMDENVSLNAMKSQKVSLIRRDVSA